MDVSKGDCQVTPLGTVEGPPAISVIRRNAKPSELTAYCCSSLCEIGPHRLIGLNVWSLVSRSVVGRIEMCSLVGGGVSLKCGLESFKSPSHSSLSSVSLSLCLLSLTRDKI